MAGEHSQSMRGAYLEPLLSELGLPLPTSEDQARALKKTIVSFENFKRLAAKYKAEQK